jgi:hypothetical protein
VSRTDYRKIYQAIRETSPEVLLRAASICDGHTIFDPQAFRDAGLPESVVAHVNRRHESSGTDPKSTLFVRGLTVPAIEGVYGLQLLRLLARALHVEYRAAYGRGTEATNITTALREHFMSARPKRA